MASSNRSNMSDLERNAYAYATGKRKGPIRDYVKKTVREGGDALSGQVLSPDDQDLSTRVVQHGASMLSTPVIADAVELYAHAKALKESAEAATKELLYKRKAGMYLPREDVRRAAATAFSAIAQSLRSIPDLLERQIGLDPGVAERVGIVIDNHLAELSEDLRRMHEATTIDEVTD